MSLQARKVQEGQEHLREADRHLETSVWKLKFAPDWDSAANDLSKAAICFKVTSVGKVIVVDELEKVVIDYQETVWIEKIA